MINGSDSLGAAHPNAPHLDVARRLQWAIVVHGRRFPCHRLVLAYRSQFFRTLFQQPPLFPEVCAGRSDPCLFYFIHFDTFSPLFSS